MSKELKKAFCHPSKPKVLIQYMKCDLSVMCRELGYNAYTVESVEDLTKPFVSVYFGAAYMAWLSTYEGRWDFFTLASLSSVFIDNQNR